MEDALTAGRYADAARLVRSFPAEWEEIRYLYPEFLRRTLAELRRQIGESVVIDRFEERLNAELGPDYEAPAAQRRLDAEVQAVADAYAAGYASVDRMEALLITWRELHDVWRDSLAAAIDLGVELLGENQLGRLWATIQKDEIDAYDRYDPARQPWADSFDEVVQSAVTGMHGHLCGPKFDGEIAMVNYDDHVELRFEPCGSGGRLRDEERFGVTEQRHDWAWNRVGVCNYCVHCCVLQQLTPIDRFGIPVRVIDPPTAPGDPCTWRVYRSPDQIPESAYLEVGRRAPQGNPRGDDAVPADADPAGS